MCFIKKSIRPRNIGKIVITKECLGKMEAGQKFDYQMHVSMAQITDVFWVVTDPAGGLETAFGLSSEVFIPDSWLHPIRPDPDDVDESETTKLFDEVEA